MVRTLPTIYKAMDEAGAARTVADINGLVEALKTLLSDTANASQLGKNARHYASQSGDSVVAEIIKLLERILPEPVS